MNEVIRYNSGAPIIETPTPILNQPSHEYNVIRVKNETGVDINLNFTDSPNSDGAGALYIVKADDDLLHAFKCSGRVLASAAAPTSGNFFIQLTKA